MGGAACTQAVKITKSTMITNGKTIFLSEYNFVQELKRPSKNACLDTAGKAFASNIKFFVQLPL